MSCRIEKVLAPNGDISNVYTQISSVYGAEVGLAAYLHMHSAEFLDKHEGKMKDGSGEYPVHIVMDSLNTTDNTIKKVVERANEVRKGNTLVKFEHKNAVKKAETANAIFKRDGQPFIAQVVYEEDGTATVHIGTTNTSEPNYMARENRKRSHRDHNDLDNLEDVEEEEDYDEDTHLDDEPDMMDDIFGNTIKGSNRRKGKGRSTLDASDVFGVDFDEDITRGRDRGKTKSKTNTDEAHAFQNVIRNLRRQRKSLGKRLARVDSAIDRAIKDGDDTKVIRLKELAAKYASQIDKIKDEESLVFKTSRLEQVKNVAYRDIRRIQNKEHELSELTEEELMDMDRTLRFWVKTGTFDAKGDHLIFNKVQLKSTALKNLFRGVKKTAEDVLINVSNELDNRFETFVKDQVGEHVTKDQIMKMAGDLGILQASSLDISRFDNMILQAIFKGVVKAEQHADQEADVIITKIDEMMPKVLERLEQLNMKGNPFDLFTQTDSQGLKTGNIVTAISADFDRAKEEMWTDVMKNKPTKAQAKKAKEWIKDNEIFFDLRKLFPDHPLNKTKRVKPFTKEDRAKHIEELKKYLPADKVDKTIADIEKQLFEYEIEYKYAMEQLEIELQDKPKALLASKKDRWKLKNSPFYGCKYLDTRVHAKYAGKKIFNNAIRYTKTLPKKKEWYDSKYETIQNDEVLTEFYDFYIDTMSTLNKFLPSHARKDFKDNSVMFVQRTLKEMLIDAKGDKRLTTKGVIHKHMLEANRSKDYKTVTSNTTDPVSGQQIREVQASFVDEHKGKLNDMVKEKQLKWQGKNMGEQAPPELIREWKYKALNELASEKSFDLGHVLKNYALLATAYKHKSNVQDKIHLAHEMFRQIKEEVINARGEQIKDEVGEAQGKIGLAKMQEALDHFMDNFDNFKTKEEDASSLAPKTKLEKQRIAELKEASDLIKKQLDEGVISKKNHAELQAEIDEAIKKIGGQISKTKVSDNILKIVQVKGMGWNAPAAFVNVLFGQISNFIESASQRIVDYDDIMFGTRIMMRPGSVERNKALIIADKWKIITTNLDLVNQSHKEGFLGRAPEWAQPYAMGNWAEVNNQCPLMIAMMRKTPITDKDGNVSNIWDALDEEGNLLPQFKEGEIGEDNVRDWEGDKTSFGENEKLHELIMQTKQIIKKVHGNYDTKSPILGKKKILGRAALQFRSWIGEAIANRFEDEKYDSILKITRKGRYKSLYKAKDVNGNPILAADLLINEMGSLLKGILFGYEESGNLQISEVDIQNLREVARELTVILGTFGVILLLTMLKGDDDDEPTVKTQGINFLLNNLYKLVSDLMSFMSPFWIFDFLDNPIPSMSLLKDSKDVFNAFLRTMGGEPTIETGVNAGWNRIAKETIELAPATSQLFKFKNMTQRIFENPQSITYNSSRTARNIYDYIFGDD